MGSSPMLTVLEHAQVSPPVTTVGDKLLPLTYFDFFWLRHRPVHYLYFYELPIIKPQFIETTIPNLKHSLSITLQHFFPFSGNLIVYPTSSQKPEIRYVEGDSVRVTFAESNLDFNELTGNHPRDCGMFYDLIPQLGEADKTSDSIKIPLFSVQVTLFPNSGFSIGMRNHHCLGDASTRSCFLKAWTSIARFGTDEWFLANGNLPFYERVVQNHELDDIFVKRGKVESFKQEYQPRVLRGPTDKVRATFVLPRAVLNRFKNLVSTLAYVSSFTVACAYIWSCKASKGVDELQLFGFPIDCRLRMNPVISAAYFGNCLDWCVSMANSPKLTGKEGFMSAAKLIGENLHKTLIDKDGVGRDSKPLKELFANGSPTTMIWVAGTPKHKFYDMDFGWGNPKKLETVSIDYNEAISINACK